MGEGFDSGEREGAVNVGVGKGSECVKKRERLRGEERVRKRF